MITEVISDIVKILVALIPLLVSFAALLRMLYIFLRDFNVSQKDAIEFNAMVIGIVEGVKMDVQSILKKLTDKEDEEILNNKIKDMMKERIEGGG